MRQLWLRAVDQLEARPLAGTEGIGPLTWSPDSRRIAYGPAVTRGTDAPWAGIRKLDTRGGEPIAVCDCQGTRLAWGRDDAILIGASVNGTGIQRVSAAGGTPALLTSVESGERWHLDPQFLEDGRQFLYLAHPGAGSERALYLAARATPS